MEVFCAARSWALPFCKSSSFPDQTVHQEQHNRAYRCNEDAAEIEGLYFSEADLPKC